MSDFASAAMIRVLAQGMRALGLDPGPAATHGAQARVDLRQKRLLVHAALQQGGLGCLPLLGRGLHRLSHEPTHLALASARDAADLFERWQRLERYIHSRHRCAIETRTSTRARLRHGTLTGGARPSAAEDLVVLGVLAALLEAIGLQQVQVWIGATLAYPDPDLGGLQRAAISGSTAVWDFRWEASVLRPSGPADPRQCPAAGGADEAWPEAARAAYARLVCDLTRPLALPALAAALGVPGRTLQRQLGKAGLSYSTLLAQARCRSGAWRLLHTDDPIAEIGFLSGFADQPHFTREMQRHVGLPPTAYRQAFGPVRRPVR